MWGVPKSTEVEQSSDIMSKEEACFFITLSTILDLLQPYTMVNSDIMKVQSKSWSSLLTSPLAENNGGKGELTEFVKKHNECLL